MIQFLLVVFFFLGRPAWAENVKQPEPTATKLEKAYFAGGCFWCMEPPFEKLKGVKGVVSGYSGGDTPHPTYEMVSRGETGYVEIVEIQYDPKHITFDKLLSVFWRQIDPTDAGGQFVDRGTQYRSLIYYVSDEQKKLAEKSKEEIKRFFKKPIVTEILAFKNFYPAEEYHQDYYRKNPIRYKFYRKGSGRDKFLNETWATKK